MKAISIIIALMATALQINSTFAKGIPGVIGRIPGGGILLQQISLTGAVANPDSVTTPDSRPIVINVIANDLIATGVLVPSTTPVVAVTTPVIVTGNGVIDAGSVSTSGVAVGSILYTPAAGFIGIVTFDYVISIQSLGPSVGHLPENELNELNENELTELTPTATGSFDATRRHLRSRRTMGTKRNERQLADGPTLTGIVTVTVLAIEDRTVFRAETQVSTDTALALVDLSNLREPSFNFNATKANRLAAGGGV
jgi:hypothetical protein